MSPESHMELSIEINMESGMDYEEAVFQAVEEGVKTYEGFIIAISEKIDNFELI